MLLGVPVIWSKFWWLVFGFAEFVVLWKKWLGELKLLLLNLWETCLKTTHKFKEKVQRGYFALFGPMQNFIVTKFCFERNLLNLSFYVYIISCVWSQLGFFLSDIRTKTASISYDYCVYCVYVLCTMCMHT